MSPSSQLTTLLKKILLPSTPWKLPLKNPLVVGIIRPFSALPSSNAAQKRWSFFSEEESDAETSPVYDHALKFQRPSTIIYGENSVNNRPLNLQRSVPSVYKKQPTNSVSLIGSIEFPLKRIQTTKRLGYHTMLKIQASPQSKNTFRVMLKMWGEMAEMSMHHLKQDDFVYVCGHLDSYTKTDENGKSRVFYEVIVKELNYVVRHGEKTVNEQAKKVDVQGEDYEERRRNRLHLWQVFFANPHEWKDLRKSKTKPKHPDFKNMSTGEALWLKPGDPPWIQKQLEFYDSVSAGNNPAGRMSPTSFRSLLASDTTDGTGEPSRGEEIKSTAPVG